jgi:endonuclease/exonuclease/phosphatase family metal-dependent hydrolase
MLVRAWNLHLGKDAKGHGNHVREMVELVTAGGPAIVCLQEVPDWAVDDLPKWTGMAVSSVRMHRAKLGLLPAPGALARTIGSAGKANAILFPAEAKLRQEKQITLNTNPFCEEQAAKLGLNLKEAHWWERERRVCHIAHIEFPDRKRWMIANLHATSRASDRRLADAELARAAKFLDRQAETEETVVIAGDLNIPLAESAVLHELTTRPDERFAAVSQGEAQILVRGRITMSGLRIWPDGERTRDGKLLSDHAPVEVDVAYRVRREAPPAEEPERPKLPSLDEVQSLRPRDEPAPPPQVEAAPAPEQQPQA